MDTEVRLKFWAALLLAEEGMKKLLGSASSTVSAEPHTASSMKSSMKREIVSLPKFVGSERGDNSPFLDFVVWLENWQQHIVNYETKSRSNLLLNHLDKDAIRRIAGMENDYTGAMKKLEEYFGDQTKIIRDCMAVVNNFSKVAPNDFKNLVFLKFCIEVNYARLKSCDLENEINNTQSMKAIEAKFPPFERMDRISA